ncbi:Hypothetical predicted protein [Octopus vulgaris]|uniref:Uncharacterized protein n=1 Tax=Octopus vulgaris TaxID=6645 RepID=A0AA36B6Y5_OCTVU|nr:Hypothetical predicted protein [Octopus vulgaris]
MKNTSEKANLLKSGWENLVPDRTSERKVLQDGRRESKQNRKQTAREIFVRVLIYFSQKYTGISIIIAGMVETLNLKPHDSPYKEFSQFLLVHCCPESTTGKLWVVVVLVIAAAAVSVRVELTVGLLKNDFTTQRI